MQIQARKLDIKQAQNVFYANMRQETEQQNDANIKRVKKPLTML